MNESPVVGFALVSFAIIVIPGPSVLFAVSRAISDGRRRALLIVLGNAAGLFAQVVVVALGLGVVVSGSAEIYTALKLVGAAYLAWLGVDAIRHRERTTGGSAAVSAAVGDRSLPMLRDGFVVGASNPKSLVFLAALLPQYVQPAAGMAAAQLMLLGALFCVIAIICDSAWVMAASTARGWLGANGQRRRASSVASGLVMIALGALLLLSG
jgi:threonine/homoserine/homoserine lactone efflux protein